MFYNYNKAVLGCLLNYLINRIFSTVDLWILCELGPKKQKEKKTGHLRSACRKKMKLIFLWRRVAAEAISKYVFVKSVKMEKQKKIPGVEMARMVHNLMDWHEWPEENGRLKTLTTVTQRSGISWSCYTLYSQWLARMCCYFLWQVVSLPATIWHCANLSIWGAAQCALTYRGVDTPVSSFSSTSLRWLWPVWHYHCGWWPWLLRVHDPLLSGNALC